MRLPGALARPIVFACLTAVAGAAALAGSAPVRLVGVSARSDRNGQTVLIEATEPVAYTIKRPDPLTVLVDLRDVAVGAAARRASQLSEGPVRTMSVEELKEPDGGSFARVRLELAAPTPHRVRSTRNTIRVEFARGSAAPAGAETPAAKTSAPPRDPLPMPMATSLKSVGMAVRPGGVAVTLGGNGRLEPSRVIEATDLPPRVVLDFPGVESNAPAQTMGPGDPVQRVRIARHSQTPLVTRVVVDLERMVPYRLERSGVDGQDLAIVFDTAAPTAPDQAAVAAQGGASSEAVSAADAIDPFSALALASTAAPPPAAVVAAEPPARTAPPAPAAPAVEPLAIRRAAGSPATSTAPRRAPVTHTAPPSAQVLAPPRQAPAQTPPLPEPQPGSQRYSGQPISFDFQGADLRSVLRLFASPEVSGLNMVIDPAVQGTVDVLLNEVPWDQALDIILRGNKLGYSVDGNVVRIAPLAVLAEEESARRKLAEAQELAGELTVITKSLSYAKANNLKDLITRSVLSQRGEVQVDERTNTLIIKDLQSKLDTAERLIADLDRPEPQVEIEARIVQTSRDFARALGVRWGLNGRMAPEMGNTSPWGFPNRGVLEGRVGGTLGPVDPRASALDKFGTAVNLGASAATSGIGLLMQSVNGSFNLDVALTALENSGKGRILSTPRVTTQNNQEAEMTQGVQIPVQTVANNTVTVTFKDAALTLKVTPQITSADTVIMRIILENATPDYSRQVNNIPPIDTQRAITSVQVSDGATTVIGGIFVSEETTQNARVPLLHKIPLLGWLFRRDEANDKSRELLIFITPRILRG
mgnify:FL=1